MCGICGYINNNNRYNNYDLIREMNKQIKHRGPDDEGYYIDDDIVLGQVRLSIIDLSSEGHQPMVDVSDKFIIVFNGEIYNFREIRSELELLGYTFFSNTDTEVILYSYKEWGKNCVKKFNGMFAFAIWEKENKALTLFRDRVGIKPLYYFYDNNNFVFSSELKGIIQYPEFEKKINLDSLYMFFTFGYIPSPHSIYNNVYKLEAGSYIEFNGGQIRKERYWDMIDISSKKKLEYNSEKEILDELERILRLAVERNSISDVPIGAFLSGGIDSSLVVSLLQSFSNENIKTFSIGFNDDKYNEAEYAKNIAEYLGTDHTELYVNDEDLMDMIDDIVNYYDEPFSDSSSIPTMLVSRLAKESVTVVLSGDGGDELFCGYKHYSYLRKLGILHKLPHFARKAFSKIVKRSNDKLAYVLETDDDFSDMVLRMKSIIPSDKLEKLLLNPGGIDRTIAFFTPYKKMTKANIEEIDMVSDFSQYMVDDVLTKVDRASMKYALEARVPILDHNVVEYAQCIPLNLKYKNGEFKYILKELLYRYIPKEMLDRPKKGFSVPLSSWINGPLKNEIDHFLSKDFIEKQGVFNYFEINKMRNDGQLKADQVWSIYIFQKWYEKYLL